MKVQLFPVSAPKLANFKTVLWN